jgi:hypothetical protein
MSDSYRAKIKDKFLMLVSLARYGPAEIKGIIAYHFANYQYVMIYIAFDQNENCSLSTTNFERESLFNMGSYT